MSAKDALTPLFSELESLMRAHARSISQTEAELLLVGIVDVMRSVVLWAGDQLSDGLNVSYSNICHPLLTSFSLGRALCPGEGLNRSVSSIHRRIHCK